MEEDQHQNQIPVKQPSLLSKKRFEEIKQLIYNTYGDNELTNIFINSFCRIMNFNPEYGLYTPEHKNRLYSKVKQKAAELGISVYALTGKDTYYQNNKEKLNKARAECLRKQRLRLRDATSAEQNAIISTDDTAPPLQQLSLHD